MSGGTAFGVIFVAAAGVGGTIQAAVQATLGDRVGTIEALGFAMLVAGAAGALVLLVGRQSFHAVPASLQQPAWLWVGGALSAFIVLSLTFAAPRIGVSGALGVYIAGTLISAAAVDHFGWLGVERIALGWPRLVGIVLLLGGAALVLRR
ncbi:MAG TPA: DMT family transporter [Gaiellaceae bacterium]|nr:DMT family transporter [Gaiellaceae bacterium]